MDYNLDGYLDEDMIKKMNSISIKLDFVMDDLFLGKKNEIRDLKKDRILLDEIRNEYNELIESVTKMLKDTRTSLSSLAGKRFILGYISSMLIFASPLFFIIGLSAFSKGMKYYASSQVLSNNDVINEYLSYFDDIKRRINNYDEVVETKINKLLCLEQ